MSTTGKIILLIINAIVLFASIFWFISKPDYDSGIASLVALSAFVGLLFIKTEKKDKAIKMSQTGGHNSTFYQSNGPMNINK